MRKHRTYMAELTGNCQCRAVLVTALLPHRWQFVINYNGLRFKLA